MLCELLKIAVKNTFLFETRQFSLKNMRVGRSTSRGSVDILTCRFGHIKKEVAQCTTSSPNQIKPNYKFIFSEDFADV